MIKPKKTPKMIKQRRKSLYGKRKFKETQKYKPIHSIEKGLNVSKTNLIYFRKNTSNSRKLKELEKRIKTKLRIRKTDNLSFFQFKREYYAEAFSKERKFRQLFEIKDKNAIQALNYFEKIQKGI